MAIENMRLNLRSKMVPEWRFRSDLHGKVGMDELCKRKRECREEEKKAGENRQG